MTMIDDSIEAEIRDTESIKIGDQVETYSPSATEAEIIRIDAHTDIPAVDVVVIVDVDVDIDAIVVIDVDVDIDVDIDTPHIDQA